ncbi:integrase_H2C2 domain-containing protein [Nephila pilipes]|uniref:Integrase_H2C2 domain-containing protein n=1 Tax=Nephila pilipes TaxID=299642 RepID=A0A8X6QM59_NEPPI|nr:integrase_H2C2 domain-containing protein [Nephila pilipes]
MVNIQTADIMSDYFSTYSRNVRVVTWILRFIHNISNVNKLRGNLVYEEFKKAENLVFKSMQLRSFQDEKFLAKMQAFKDEEGLLRIRTKLVDSDEKEDFKFPVLLPANDVVVKLIREEHKKAMHAGSYIQLARLRENFWIIKAKNSYKGTESHVSFPVLGEAVQGYLLLPSSTGRMDNSLGLMIKLVGVSHRDTTSTQLLLLFIAIREDLECFRGCTAKCF